MRETSPPASGKRTPFGVENIICHILVPCKIFSFPVFTGQEPIDPGEWESFTKREIPDPGRSVEVIGFLCAAGSPRGRNLQQGLGRLSASAGDPPTKIGRASCRERVEDREGDG